MNINPGYIDALVYSSYCKLLDLIDFFKHEAIYGRRRSSRSIKAILRST